MTGEPGVTVTREQALQWLLAWFRRRETAAGKEPLDPAANYFESGLVDSLGLMELIAGLEETFRVRFTEDHFQDPRFATMDGLAELAAELSNGKS